VTTKPWKCAIYCHARRIELNLEVESRRFQSYWESHGGGGIGFPGIPVLGETFCKFILRLVENAKLGQVNNKSTSGGTTYIQEWQHRTK
jgi:hypothetical protein